MRNYLSNIFIISLVGLIGIYATTPVLAKVGVGVGLGKVQIDEMLAPGGIYKLPVLPVLNTGDETSTYEVEVTYQNDQEQFRPEGEWFNFIPQNFSLDPGESQPVEVKLNLPVQTRPGDYFAYLEAHPVNDQEGVSIGIAAATKLYFTVEPSGVLGAMTERIRSLIENNTPLSYWVLGAATLVIFVIVFQRIFVLEFKLRKNQPTDEQQKKE